MATSNRFERIRHTVTEYPRQFWLLFGGLLVNTIGSSMVWPFLTIYVRQRLDVPLTTVGLLLALYSASGLVSSVLGGPVADRVGRKGVMAFGLLAGSLNYVVMSRADTLAAWVVLMLVSGAINPLFRVGSDAMVADLLPPARRSGAYALVRMSSNLGVAIGPAIGGFIATASYTLAFYGAAAASAAFGFLVLLTMTETMPLAGARSEPRSGDRGYGRLLRDRSFLPFCAVSLLAVIPSSLMWVLLAVYVKEQHGVPESQYGFIMTTNAAMVVLFQYGVTRAASRYRPLPVMAVGVLLYALGVGSVALGSRFPHFLLSMVVLTLGEMLLVPTGTTMAANLSPADMRGRYMSFYGLTWMIGIGIGPVLGGYLSDQISPVAIWLSGLAIGLAATVGYLALDRLLPRFKSA